ncbi:MAG: hemerythrin domain-containing protein [Proteobacteria bacterium]|nr:hemerythrin domain-containing protein [Pseudomonadota bacterium]
MPGMHKIMQNPAIFIVPLYIWEPPIYHVSAAFDLMERIGARRTDGRITMFDFLNDNNESAITILKRDHEHIRALLDAYEAARELREKRVILKKIIEELKIHAFIEEEIFYKAVYEVVKEDLINEADEEHHVTKILIAELANMMVSQEGFDAKVEVLADNIRHHIREEETKLLPHVSRLDIDLISLGKEMLAKKTDLKIHGMPVFAEETMMKRVGRHSEECEVGSTATASKRKGAKIKRRRKNKN